MSDVYLTTKELEGKYKVSSSLLHLWIFAPSVTQKSRLSGLLWQLAG
jgi:hypothetical protein